MNATTKTTKTEPTAAEAYAACRNDVARMMRELKIKLDENAARRMKIIRMGLDKQDEAHIADSRNWGHVDSLRQFQSELLNLIGFVSDLDPELDSFLNDAE